MNDIMTLLGTLRRPKLLIRAARHGVEGYNRDRDLRRILKSPEMPTARKAILRLIDEERELEHARSTGSAHYNVARHVDVMIAMMGEARFVQSALAA